MSAEPKSPVPPIPLTVVTGFLGAGKTTLINRLLKDPELADTVVIVNEFGEIGLDHLLLETLDEGMVLMQSGCLCCTIRGDLVNTLEGLLRKRDNGRITPFRRVLIETTGLADPAPILQTVMAHPYLGLRYSLEGVITLVDAVNGMATLDIQPEAVKQAAVADRLVLTKRDLAGKAAEALIGRLRRLNPLAPLVDAADATASDLLDCGLYDPATKAPDVARWLGDEDLLAALGRKAHRHADGTIHADGDDLRAAAAARGQDHNDPNRHDASIRAHAFATGKPIAAESFALFQDLLRAAHGPKLLRLKGIVKIAESPDNPAVIHGVQHVFHPPVILDHWPDDDQRTRLVFITRDLEPGFVEGLWNAFLGADG
ncbi:MAG: GTP-binding protein [Methylocystis sp.]|nr:GTP-binding protein [Methylocystis sp.]MCA3583699.1 GTP-binding protein [Methylocystis sp.]MCA3587711.1 GTP-binding protein [Methylocystis sp.]MCA3590027.1 GTP-binding protein [Methylocystis sp.]